VVLSLVVLDPLRLVVLGGQLGALGTPAGLTWSVACSPGGALRSRCGSCWRCRCSCGLRTAPTAGERAPAAPTPLPASCGGFSGFLAQWPCCDAQQLRIKHDACHSYESCASKVKPRFLHMIAECMMQRSVQGRPPRARSAETARIPQSSVLRSPAVLQEGGETPPPSDGRAHRKCAATASRDSSRRTSPAWYRACIIVTGIQRPPVRISTASVSSSIGSALTKNSAWSSP